MEWTLFVTGENQDKRRGVSLGNFINLSITDEITGTFKNRITKDPLFMHEYRHTFDGQNFGPLYLPIIGLPSAISAETSRSIGGGLSSHDIRWYERSANKHAARYFGRYFGIDWSSYEPPYDGYPRRKP